MADWHRWDRKTERERYPLRNGFKRNEGQMPHGKKEKTVEVALMNGELGKVHWLVKTTRWTLTGWWHDVDQYRVVD